MLQTLELISFIQVIALDNKFSENKERMSNYDDTVAHILQAGPGSETDTLVLIIRGNSQQAPFLALRRF